MSVFVNCEFSRNTWHGGHLLRGVTMVYDTYMHLLLFIWLCCNAIKLFDTTDCAVKSKFAFTVMDTFNCISKFITR